MTLWCILQLLVLCIQETMQIVHGFTHCHKVIVPRSACWRGKSVGMVLHAAQAYYSRQQCSIHSASYHQEGIEALHK